MFYICDNILMGDTEVDGSIEEAMRIADERAGYTQEDIKIFSDAEHQNLVARRYWQPCWEDGEREDEEFLKKVIGFGDFGYFDEWITY